uniref:NADH:ubiquinone reductase (H(+)-translocating) n=1 Tax=Pallisentis celatus TaxID=935648 RepID=V5IXC2_PALCE|nr:NADH dehydrogenase subunit 5 [Pallisentis celatus]AFK50138.1 NADH dehydrogenase subunit 5 [Pallisentis celatus]
MVFFSLGLLISWVVLLLGSLLIGVWAVGTLDLSVVLSELDMSVASFGVVGYFVVVLLWVYISVLLFSGLYMTGEALDGSFCYMVLLFVLGMVVYVVFTDLLGVILGWEILGVVSFILIFYYGNYLSKISSFMTVMVNRLGDVGVFMLLLAWLYSDHLGFGGSSLGWFVLVCLLSKSAQFPFSFWLPMAMAAPTPVSSLVHSSTLVTAGVYMVLRMGVDIDVLIMGLVFFMCSGTMLYAGLSSLWELDYKKVVALSTLFHLALMGMFLGLNYLELGGFHLLAHALFKSGVFMSVGVLIFLWSHEQDFRLVGLPKGVVGVVLVSLFMGVVSLMGLPYFSGGMMKEFFLSCFVSDSGSVLTGMVVFVGLSCSLVYSFKLISPWWSQSGSGLIGGVFLMRGGSFGFIFSMVLFSLFVGFMVFSVVWVDSEACLLTGADFMFYVVLVVAMFLVSFFAFSWGYLGLGLKDLWGFSWSSMAMFFVAMFSSVEDVNLVVVGEWTGTGVSRSVGLVSVWVLVFSVILVSLLGMVVVFI